ncbi:MAG: RnfH family protein [Gammaproteobacteria bacterium]|nr:RnfH family protein [Gammaproteobacteria bacterium]
MGSADIRVDVVYATPACQIEKTVILPRGSSVETAIRASGLLKEFPEISLTVNRVGIFGEVVALDSSLDDGARVEIYRPLIADPKEARRLRAKRGAGKRR